MTNDQVSIIHAAHRRNLRRRSTSCLKQIELALELWDRRPRQAEDRFDALNILDQLADLYRDARGATKATKASEEFNSTCSLRPHAGIGVAREQWGTPPWRAKPVSLLWACEECGCTDVQTTAWIDVNTEDLIDGDPPFDHHFCPRCDGEARIAATAVVSDPFVERYA